MDALVELVVQNAGLVVEQAEQAIATVSSYLKSSLPGQVSSQVELALNGVNLQVRIDRMFQAIRPPFDAGDILVVEQTLNQGIDVNTADAVGDTLLHFAAYWNREEIVRLLIARGADLNVCDKHGRTPIHIAACANTTGLRVARLLLAGGAEPDIFTICLMGDEQQTLALIEDKPERVHKRESFRDDTPLHKAAETGHLAVVKILLQHGADVRTQNHLGETPLHRAAEYDHPDVAELLISNGAEVNARNKAGATPLDQVVFHHGVRAAVAHVLQNHGGRQHIEIRSIRWDTFMTELKRHYAELECEVEFAMADDGSCIDTYNVRPKGARYFLKKINERGGPGWQDQALEEIKDIFFPMEDVVVREINQWREIADDMDVNLVVELL